MKTLALAVMILTLTAMQSSGQFPSAVRLKWKIDRREAVKYATAMDEVQSSLIQPELGSLLGSIEDSLMRDSSASQFFSQVQQEMSAQRYITTLTNAQSGIVDIVMSAANDSADKAINTKKASTNGKGLMDLMRVMNQGVMLRGSVFDTGGIHSFWVKSEQKNLIALLFQLPDRPVKVGDKWPVDVSLIGNDQNFVCDSSSRINEVELVDIKRVNGDSVAVLNYNILEYVTGDFNSPVLFGNAESSAKKTLMKFVHQGRAEFSINKGRWLSYRCVMSVETTGMFGSKSRTNFELVPL